MKYVSSRDEVYIKYMQTDGGGYIEEDQIPAWLMKTDQAKVGIQAYNGRCNSGKKPKNGLQINWVLPDRKSDPVTVHDSAYPWFFWFQGLPIAGLHLRPRHHLPHNIGMRQDHGS